MDGASQKLENPNHPEGGPERNERFEEEREENLNNPLYAGNGKVGCSRKPTSKRASSMKSILQEPVTLVVTPLAGGFQLDMSHSYEDRTLAESVFEAALQTLFRSSQDTAHRR
jgi:hypothetical protein